MKDVIEELDIMIHINKTQMTVLKNFVRHSDHMLDPEGIFHPQHRRGARFRSSLSSSIPNEPSNYTASFNKGDASSETRTRDQEAYDWFRINADEQISMMRGRLDELEELRKSAQTTSDSVSNTTRVT
jgi:hypothetical protein